MPSFAIAFRVNKKIPNALSVCSDIVLKYESKIVGYAVGEDSTYMEGEEPHYHVHMITSDTSDLGRSVTMKSITKVRERHWKYGQDVKMRVSEWDSDIAFLAYAVKEKSIKVNLPLGINENDFDQKVKEVLNNKISKHNQFKKEQQIINAKKDLKNSILKYIDDNLETVKHYVSAYQSLNYNNGSMPHYYEEPALVKICLEKYQLENKKHFRQFEIERYVCEYFRTKKDYLEMYFLRNSGQKVF